MSNLCDYSNAHILVSAAMTIPKTGTAANPDTRKI